MSSITIPPLTSRPLDLFFVIWFTYHFIVALAFDLQALHDEDYLKPGTQLNDPYRPAIFHSLIEWWNDTCDPLQEHNPLWWVAMIWIEALFMVPFCLFGVYAFVAGKNWIQVPGIVYSSFLIYSLLVLLPEQLFGHHKSPNKPMLLSAYLPFLLVPFVLLYRLRRPPFEKHQKEE